MLSLTEPSWYDKNGVLQTIQTAVLEMFYPVGSIYMSTSSANPSTFMGGGWTQWGQGRVPVSVNTSDSDFSTAEKTGGAKTVTLTVSQMPSHKHSTVQHDHGERYTSSSGYPIVYSSSGSTVGGAITATTTSGSIVKTELGGGYDTGTAGSGNAHNNLQPYITCYMWKRTS